jgi:tetratricopeptide (TPR) repeat protein
MFEDSLGPMQALASVDASKIEYQQESSNVVGWLADAQKSLGRFDSAIALRQRQAAYLEHILAGGASDVALRQDLISAHQGLGVLFTFHGDLARGADEYRMALAQADRLIAVEPSNSIWKDMAASVHLYLARNLLLLGHRDEATREAATGCAVATALRAGASTVSRLRTLQTVCLTVRSRLALAAGASVEAIGLAQQALASARAERSGDPIKDRHSVAAAYLLLGDARRAAGDPDGARNAWTDALSSIPPNVAETPLEMDDHAAILERLGRTAEVRPITQQLAQIGYRRVS